MNMQIEDIDSCNKKIKFDIPHQDYKTRVNNSYRSLARETKIPGFRPGKAPLSVLEKRFGPNVKQEVLTQLISEWIANVVDEQGLRAVGPPKLLEVQAEEGTDISVSASIEIVPSFEVADCSGISITLKIPRITEEEIDRVINYYLERQGKNIQVTDRAVREKDFVKLDHKGTLDGKPFEGGEGKGHVVQVGSENLLKGMGDQLIGMMPGEEKDIPVKIPDSYANKAIAGKDVTFHVLLEGIQEKQLPEINDEFAKNTEPKGKYENLGDMKQKIRGELEEHARKDARRDAKKEVAEKIVGMNSIEIPAGLIEEQIKHMVAQELKKEQPLQEKMDDTGEEDVQVTEEQRKKHRDEAVRLLRQEFLLDQLATDLNIKVSEDELNAEINNLVKMLGETDAKKMKKEWAKSGVLLRLQSRIKRDKTLDTVMEKVQIKEEIVDRKDDIKDN